MHVTAESFYPLAMYLLSCEINGRQCISLLSTYHRQAVRLHRMSQNGLLSHVASKLIRRRCTEYRWEI